MNISEIIKILKSEYKKFREPIVTQIRNKSRDPFLILTSCILSLRTKDEVTEKASERLFRFVDTPEKMISIPEEKIAKAIYPVGFYKTKAKRLKEISKDIIEIYKGRVPDEIDELLKLKGVGRKTANLVVTLGYNKPGICVDTHVHRISNRLGYVKTQTPHETEFALREKLPQKYWIIYNDLLVSYGQSVCRPVSPVCSKCRIEKYCGKVGVEIRR